MKRYLNEALLYAVLSLVGGVFYREFTKIHGFVKKTTLEVVHTHYFILGMIVLLLLLLLEKNFSFTSAKTDRILVVYHAGLNLTAVMLMVRGVTQVLGTALSSRHGRCYLRYGWHRTHPSGSKLGSLVTSDPAQHI